MAETVEPKVIYAAPVGGDYEHPEDAKKPKEKRRTIWIDELQTAVNRARPGDDVALLPGNYLEPVVINVSGEEDKPITIRAFNEGEPPLLDGMQSPEDGRHAGMEPLDGDFAFFKVIRAKHIVFKALKFDRCWPSAFFSALGAGDHDPQMPRAQGAVFCLCAATRRLSDAGHPD